MSGRDPSRRKLVLRWVMLVGGVLFVVIAFVGALLQDATR